MLSLEIKHAHFEHSKPSARSEDFLWATRLLQTQNTSDGLTSAYRPLSWWPLRVAAGLAPLATGLAPSQGRAVDSELPPSSSKLRGEQYYPLE